MINLWLEPDAPEHTVEDCLREPKSAFGLALIKFGPVQAGLFVALSTTVTNFKKRMRSDLTYFR